MLPVDQFRVNQTPQKNAGGDSIVTSASKHAPHTTQTRGVKLDAEWPTEARLQRHCVTDARFTCSFGGNRGCTYFGQAHGTKEYTLRPPRGRSAFVKGDRRCRRSTRTQSTSRNTIVPMGRRNGTSVALGGGEAEQRSQQLPRFRAKRVFRLCLVQMESGRSPSSSTSAGTDFGPFWSRPRTLDAPNRRPTASRLCFRWANTAESHRSGN